MSYRNWNSNGYATICNYATKQYNMQGILDGGPTLIENEYGENISALCEKKPLNLIGQTNIKQLLALLGKSDVVIAPDSGPAHMAAAVSTPVIGFYACTNPDRARPYFNSRLVVNKYPEAIAEKYYSSIDKLPWGTRARDKGTMGKIKVLDVTEKLGNL